MNNTSPFRAAAGILMSWLTPLWCLFLADPEIFFAFLDLSFHQTRAGNILRGGLVLVNLGLFAGTAGVLVRLAAGEKFLATWQDFRAGIRRYWFDVLCFWGAALAAHFITFLIVPAGGVTLRFIFAYFQIPLTAFLALILVRKQYLVPLKLERRRILVSGPEALRLIAVFVAFIGLYYAARMIVIPGWDVYRMILLVMKAGELWIFTVLLLMIARAYPEIAQTFSTGREIVLVNPLNSGLAGGFSSMFQFSYPPVFVVLKALTPAGYRFREFNRVIWHTRYCTPGRLVCITSFTSNTSEAYKIAKGFRQAGSKVIMGGPHVTYLPEEALEFCDSVVVGDAEGVWDDVIRDYEQGQLKRVYSGGMAGNYSERVHQALLNSPPEVIKDFLETTRGCKFRCRFCTIPGLSGGKTINKPVFDLVELLEKVRARYRHVTFIDNNIYSDPAYARELFAAIKPLNLCWATQCTLDIAKNDETLRLARESGCEMLFFGYETFAGSAEKEQGGKFAMADKYLEYSRRVKALGIKIKANFICGWDSDSPATLVGLWKFCFKLRPYFTVLSLYTPLPGSGIYDDMAGANRLTNLNWSRYDCWSMVFRHPRLQPDVFTAIFPWLSAVFLLTTSTMGFVLLGSGLFIILMWSLFLGGV